jgi:hypothetical protein
MPTQNQKDVLLKKLREYKKKYLKKEFTELDESGTRIMVNALLTEVLGYKELEDIKTEYSIRGGYADYVIQLKRKKHFIVEVKAIQLDILERHLRQSVNYAANEGIDWVLLTNGKQVELYRVIFSKPIREQRIFSYDLSDPADLNNAANFLVYLSKKSIIKNELEHFWLRFQALEPNNLCRNLFDSEVIRFLRRILKKKTGLYFNDSDILESIHRIISTELICNMPRNPLSVIKKDKK